MQDLSSSLDTCEQILREREPNFFRLYLNPHVARTCFCLDHYVSTTWTRLTMSGRQDQPPAEDCQSFLANSLEEALSGAIKLARFNRYAVDRRATGLVLDPADRLTAFAGADLPDGGRVEFLPGVRWIGKSQLDSNRQFSDQKTWPWMDVPGSTAPPSIRWCWSPGRMSF